MTLDVDIDPDDICTNPSAGPSFDAVVRRRTSRRIVLTGTMAGAAAFFTTSLGGPVPALARGTSRVSAAELLGFSPIPLGYADEIVVPPGYTARAFIPWGTPIAGSYPEFVPGGNTAGEQEQQIGTSPKMRVSHSFGGSSPAFPAPRSQVWSRPLTSARCS